jgi:integration host factor subunit beta
MTRADLIDVLAEQANLTRKEAETFVETIFDRIADALARGEKVELRGLGSFRIRHRRPRLGLNPKARTRVEVPAKRAVLFRAGKALRNIVRRTG